MRRSIPHLNIKFQKFASQTVPTADNITRMYWIRDQQGVLPSFHIRLMKTGIQLDSDPMTHGMLNNKYAALGIILKKTSKSVILSTNKIPTPPIVINIKRLTTQAIQWPLCVSGQAMSSERDTSKITPRKIHWTFRT